MSMQLEKGVEVLFGTSSRLDTRLSGVCQMALKVGDHLQVGSAQQHILQGFRYLSVLNQPQSVF